MHHRNTGIGWLEDGAPPLGPKLGSLPKALAHFQAIEKLQPGLAFGYANEAVTLLDLVGSDANDKERRRQQETMTTFREQGLGA